jgi:hypothetical protein
MSHYGILYVGSELACANFMVEVANRMLKGMSEAAQEEDNTEVVMTVDHTGVDIGLDPGKYGMCKNLKKLIYKLFCMAI